MKKFLTFYLIFVFLLLISFLVLRSKEGTEKRQVKIAHNDQKKKIIVITTEEFEPRGRVVCTTANGAIFSDWMSAEDAVLEMKEVEERYRKCERDYETFVQYDKWPD